MTKIKTLTKQLEALTKELYEKINSNPSEDAYQFDKERYLRLTVHALRREILARIDKIEFFYEAMEIEPVSVDNPSLNYNDKI